MKKVIKKELLYDKGEIAKWSTNIKNLFLYEVQNGWGYGRSIIENNRNRNSDTYKEKSIIIAHYDYCNGKRCGGIVGICRDKRMKSYYDISDYVEGYIHPIQYHFPHKFITPSEDEITYFI